MPKELYEAWNTLDSVRQEYNQGLHASKKCLQKAQWDFDLAKKSLKHQAKNTNTLAAKHPHAPVVSAIDKSRTEASDNIMILRDSLMGEMLQLREDNTRTITALINEVRELRRVSCVRLSLGY